MFVKNLKITNYRSIKNDNYEVQFAVPNGKEGSGLTVIVGPNNVGKSNIFHALDFLFNKSGADNVKNKQRSDAVSSVSVELFGNSVATTIDEYVQDNKKASFKELIYDREQTPHFSIQRQTDDSIKLIEIWDDSSSKFKNVAGIDAPIQKWLHFLPLWANTTTEEVADYSAKSIIGELLSKIVEEIQSDDDYVKLQEQFEKIFGSDANSTLTTKTSTISSEVSKLIQEQFQGVGIKFKAEPPKIDQYVKQIKTIVDDGDETEISQKGHGLQRAIMIALIQVYANSLNTGTAKKPFFLFIDEPELYLNPQAQKLLLRALRKISANEQVFLVTHSPYFIDWADYENGAKIGRAKKDDDSTIVCWLKTETDYSKLISNDVLDWQKPYLLDVTAKELLFAQKVLFLEGQEDVGLIKKWLVEESKEVSFDLFGYGVGGFGNYSAYLHMANDLGLTKVAAIFDAGDDEKTRLICDQKINPTYLLVQLEANDIRDKFQACYKCENCRANKFKECTSRVQYKSGCFTESGESKKLTKEYKNFCSIFENLVSFMER